MKAHRLALRATGDDGKNPPFRQRRICNIFMLLNAAKRRIIMYGAILGDIIGSPYEFDRGSAIQTVTRWAAHLTQNVARQCD